MAATGGTRAARTAGIAAATTVTRTPTTSETTIVRVSSTVDVSGRSRPSSRSSWSRPTPRAMPASNPSADATTPTRKASSTTDRTTCPPVAPIARSSPSSRVRCATRIVKVLKMMNAPTTTPMAAKPRSASVKNPRNCRTGFPTCRVASVRGQHVVGGPERGLEALLQHTRRNVPARAARRPRRSTSRRRTHAARSRGRTRRT